MLSIKNVLMPYRLKLRNRDPVTLRLELKNNDNEPKLLTVKLVVARDLSVEKTTIANVMEKRIGELAPGKSKLFYYDIYPKVSARAKDYPARLVIYEHYNDYEFVGKEYKKDFIVRAVD